MGIPLKRESGRDKIQSILLTEPYHSRLRQMLAAQEDLRRIRAGSLQRRNAVYRVSRERERERDHDQQSDSETSVDSSDETLQIGYRPVIGRLRRSYQVSRLFHLLREESIPDNDSMLELNDCVNPTG